MTFHRFEPRLEGTWEFTMHGPDGADFRNRCIFRRIEAPAYLDLDHLEGMHFYKAIVTSREAGNGTRIEWTMRFSTAKELAPIRGFIEQVNEENMDRFDNHMRGPGNARPDQPE